MEKLKMIQVYPQTHEQIKILALKAGLSVRKYMEKIAQEKTDASI